MNPPSARCFTSSPTRLRRRAVLSDRRGLLRGGELLLVFVVSLLLLLFLTVALLSGCAATRATQTPGEGSAAPAAQLSGQGNISAQVDAGGWKGIEYSSAVPVGQVILMGLMLLLSHRREMARIRQNGAQVRGESGKTGGERY